VINKDKHKSLIINKWEQGYKYRPIADMVNEKFNTDYWDSERIRDVIRKYRRKIAKLNANNLLTELENKTPKYKLNKSKRNKILVLNDLHIPFQRADIVDVVRKHKDEIKAIICAGDVLDMFEISVYPSLKQYPVEQELIDAINIFREIREIVGNEVEIILSYGNHDNRWRKYIANMHQKKLYKFINPNVLEMIKSGFTLYEDGVEIHYEGVKDIKVINSWYVNINNKLICCHPNNFSKVEVKNAKTAIEHFINSGEQFTTLIVAHNHHQGEIPNYLGKYGIESGCMCLEFDYSNGNTSSKPQDYGYVLVAFDENGEIDKNETKLYKLGSTNNKKDESQVKLNF
jgi:predicted phosphodiesterase